MPYRDDRYRRRARKHNRTVLIVALVLLVEIIVLIVLLARSCSGRRGTPDLTSQPTAPVETLAPTDTPVPTEAPTPVPSPSPSPTAQSYAVDGYLPVYRNVKTTEKVIAITIDDLAQPSNLNKICQLAMDYNAKLTLFPVGEMLENAKIRNTVYRAYYELGFEIENHTYGHDKLYMLSDAEMAESIFKQQQLVSDVLGVNYQMHFLRMPGGNGEADPRTHQYLDQLGYRGILSWSYSGSNTSIKNIKQHLKPGSIFLFHTKDKDLERLKEFIPYAVSQGYRLVTLNELLGFEENQTTPLTTDPLSVPVPSPEPYVYEDYVQIGPKMKLYAVKFLQRRLVELKYMPEDSAIDGDYGSATRAGVQAFQQAAGLEISDYAEPEMQALLFSDAAPVNPNPVFPSATSPQATIDTREPDTSVDS